MATNLLFGYADVPFRSVYNGTGTTQATGYGSGREVMGPRAEHYKTSAAVNTSNNDFALPSGTTVAPDYCIIAKANLIASQDTSNQATVSLIGSASSSYTSPETQSSTLPYRASLYGTQKEDYIFFPSFGSAYRYWRFQISNGSTSFKHEYSKIYFGTGFDFGHDPIYPRSIDRKIFLNKNRQPSVRFSFTWEGITDAKINSFITNIYMYRDIAPVFLYTASGGYIDILNDYRVIHCAIITARIEVIAYDSNRIQIDFEELS